MHAWRSGLKTGAYYVRSKPATNPQPFGVCRALLMPISPQPVSTTVTVPAVVCPCDV